MGSSSSSQREQRADTRASRNQQTNQQPPPGQSATTRQPAPGPAPSRQQRGPSVVHQQQHQQQPAMPQHLMQHQHPSYQQRAPPSAQPRAPGGSNMAAARVTAEVKDAKNVEGLCTIHSKKVQIIEDCISFVVTTTVPICDYEIHMAVRETIKKGEVIFTPNRAKTPPQRITIEGEHDDLELVVPLELEEVSEQEKQYIKDYPKQIPLVLALRYVLPNGESMCEFTYVQLLPKPQVFRQMIQTKEGVFKVESMFGGDDEGAAGLGVVAAADDGSPKPEFEDDGEDECVICLTDPKDTVVVPCRHLCVCKACAERLRSEPVAQKCPVCRGPIDQMIHIDRHK